ncbi:PLP-dependent aminotransferase family protein [Pelagibius marinus]|uniref:aminotransferase-like domain-containing protein n=1 Tax=Pelagibius marinus TaxID=2762760 RepID=UPI00187287B3|nr:PLP-dependent aminotransferase family protein [Pelagibius marinus]
MTNWTPSLEGAAGPRYLAIADALARDITAGRLKAGDRLPTHRDLAWHLGVTVGTVSRAYAEAERRGLTSGEVGRGTFVNVPVSSEQLHRWHDARPGTIHLRSAPPMPCPEEAEISEVMQRVAASPRAMEMMRYQPQRGRPEHREAGALWMSRPGFEVTADHMTLSAGAHHGVLIALAAVTRPGEHIVSDSLTYPGIRSLARMLGLRLDGLERDADGPLPDAFEEACRTHDVKAIYLCPNQHNPTSVTMSEERRRDLAAVARKFGVAVIEDDTFGFLDGSEPLPLAAHVPELGYYVVGLSKTVSPGLRCGYVVAPEKAQSRLASAVHSTCWMACPLTAEIGAELIRSGVAARISAGRKREAEVRSVIAREALDGWDFDCSEGSTFLWLRLPEPWRSSEFASEAERRGVLVTPSDPFMVGRRESAPAVRVCFGPPEDHDELRRGLAILGEQLREGPSYAFNNVV